MGISSSKIRSKVFRFLTEHRVATLATVARNGKPHAAAVYFIVDTDLIIYFMTRIESLKFQNLDECAAVSMVITDENSMETVQLSGLAERVENLEEENANLTKLWTANYDNPNWPSPAVKLFESGHSVQLAVVKVSPQEMTYASFKKRDQGNIESFFEKVI